VTVIFVEGQSDRVALETLAARRGRDLAAEGLEVVPIGGAQAIRGAWTRLPPATAARGLCDAGEQRHFARVLGDAVFVCDADLEDELIRALGAAAVETVIEEQRELKPWRTFQNQPAQRDRPVEAQLRRFLGTHSGRKEQYARALVEALDLGRVPQPLDGVLAPG
jgi:hypothetical protein